MAELVTTELTIKIDVQRLEKLRRWAALLGFTTDEYVLKGTNHL
jgi:hypothetical protein